MIINKTYDWIKLLNKEDNVFVVSSLGFKKLTKIKRISKVSVTIYHNDWKFYKTTGLKLNSNKEFYFKLVEASEYNLLEYSLEIKKEEIINNLKNKKLSIHELNELEKFYKSLKENK